LKSKSVVLASFRIRSSRGTSLFSDVAFSEDELTALAGLFNLAGKLKQLKRQGWIDRGVGQPESVADHSYRVALMTLVISTRDPDIDVERAVRLALVHDLPESLTGDITPFDDRLNDGETAAVDLFHSLPEYSQQADEAKTAAERVAIHELTAALPDALRDMLVEAWEEYEAAQTPEARLVRQIDKLETWLQALEYRQQHSDLIIESFRRGTDRDIADRDLRELRMKIDQRFDSS
jgi:putative hydrolases of HD superfamily